MKLSAWRWLVVSSVLPAVLVASAETRPQYGGTLRVLTQETFTSLEPSHPAEPESLTRPNLTHLIFETLVTIDELEVAQPALAISWQASPDHRRWSLQLRQGVKFHDGTAFTAEIAAAALRAANSTWHVTTDGSAIVIDRESAYPDLLAELALSRNAICISRPGAAPVGTGAFRMVGWQPGKHLSLAANEGYWGGRPFLDSIEVETAKSFRDQLTAFQSAKADLVEIAPEQAARFAIDGPATHSSLPMKLVALVFAREPQSPDEKILREALALSIDRNSISSVLLQGAGQPAGSLLPNWMTGYAFAFSFETDLAQARRLRTQVQRVPSWTLGFDGSDSLSRVIAERIALNARDVGLLLQPVTSANPDIRLVNIALQSPVPSTALMSLTAVTGLPTPAWQNDSTEGVYAAERSLLSGERIVPLFHLPVVYAISPAVKNWKMQKDGSVDLAEVWLENRR